jgi:hypothetical protein
MPAKAPSFARLLLSILCIVSCGTCLHGASSDHSRSQAMHIWGGVRDQYTGKPIEAARIRVLPSTDNAIWRTDQEGHFSFWLAKQELDRIEIEAESYGTVSLVPTIGAVLNVRLAPESADTSTRSNVSRRNAFPLMPPSQAVAPAIMTADSGPKQSGAGSSWSSWYRLGINKAPAGYTVSRVEFWLSGDGACGRSAECRQLASTDEQVLWEFRLHGHDEIGAPSMTLSVAHLRVIFRTR